MAGHFRQAGNDWALLAAAMLNRSREAAEAKHPPAGRHRFKDREALGRLRRLRMAVALTVGKPWHGGHATPGRAPRTCMIRYGNEASSVPSAFSRPIWLRSSPPSSVKRPTTTILPSGCSANRSILPFAPGLNVASSVPSESSRPIQLRAAPPSVVKIPPTTILPSGCSARARTASFAPSGGGVAVVVKDQYAELSPSA